MPAIHATVDEAPNADEPFLTGTTRRSFSVPAKRKQRT
jgi:hypothetical protein